MIWFSATILLSFTGFYYGSYMIRDFFHLWWIGIWGLPRNLQGEWKPNARIPYWLKWRIAHHQHFRCFHCWKMLGDSVQIDHKKALVNGGSYDVTNLVATHGDCHSVKTHSIDLQQRKRVR
jgi:5-methylcytosine-specific restriction endonuclease McrA